MWVCDIHGITVKEHKEETRLFLVSSYLGPSLPPSRQLKQARSARGTEREERVRERANAASLTDCRGGRARIRRQKKLWVSLLTPAIMVTVYFPYIKTHFYVGTNMIECDKTSGKESFLRKYRQFRKNRILASKYLKYVKSVWTLYSVLTKICAFSWKLYVCTSELL